MILEQPAVASVCPMEGSLYGRVTLAPELQVSEPDPWVRQPSSSEDDEEVVVSGNMVTKLIIGAVVRG